MSIREYIRNQLFGKRAKATDTLVIYDPARRYKEFANINLGYYGEDGKLITVYCPESRNADATQCPLRFSASKIEGEITQPVVEITQVVVSTAAAETIYVIERT